MTAILPAPAQDEERVMTPEMQKTLDKIESVAKQGNRDAQYKLGLLYVGANNFPKDYKKAHKWFSIAIENGSANAIYNMGTLAEHGLGEKVDPMKAFDLYLRASERGVFKAAHKVWILSQKLNDTAEEPVIEKSAAFKHLERAADGGIVGAEAAIAREYLRGAEYVKKDVQKSLDYLRKASDKGNLASTRLLGEIFTGQVEDYQPRPDEALDLLLPSAEEGDSTSQQLLGDIYSSEVLGKRDLAKAEQWYMKAIEDGNAKARVNLGLLYANPNNKSIYDSGKAQDMLYDAAKANIPTAQFAMYKLLTDPNERNDARAHRQALIWLKAAANLNSPEAQKELAQRFLVGDDLPRSPKEAYIWGTLALNNGLMDALKIQKAAKEAMSAVQVAEADSEAQFRARKVAAAASAHSGSKS